MTQKQLKMLIVDDSPEDRELYRRLLLKDQACEYILWEADNGADAMKLLQAEKPDCILIDYRLPDIDGMELLITIAEDKRLQRIPRILLTGQGCEAVAVEAMKNGAADYLVKGELTEALFLRTIRNAVVASETQNNLRDYFAFLETLIDIIPSPLFFKNTKGKYTGCNKAFEDYLGLSKENLIGKTDFDIAPRELAEREQKKDQELFNNCGAASYEMQVLYPDGSYHNAIMTKATFANNRGKVLGLVGLMLDITERKNIEENLTKTKEELESSLAELQQMNRRIIDQQKSLITEERLKLLLQLSGATAHELNQPLTALLGTIGLLKLKKDYPQDLSKRLTALEDAGREMAAIVERMQFIQNDETIPYLGESIINLHQTLRLLAIEDSDSAYADICSCAKNLADASIAQAKGLAEARQALEKEQFNLILLDYKLADGTGLDVLRLLQEKNIDTPVIVITGQGDEVIASKVIQEGAYDYIPKTKLNESSLYRSIASVIERHRLKMELKIAARKIADSTRDGLTGLYNRRYFEELLEREVLRSKRYNGLLSLCMLDLDYFKNINDTYGHAAGDQVLCEVGALLRGSLRTSDIICRYGNDKFAVISINAALDDAMLLAERFMKALSCHEFTFNSSTFTATVSIGIVCLDRLAEQSAAELVRKADAALYQAKQQGRNRSIPGE